MIDTIRFGVGGDYGPSLFKNLNYVMKKLSTLESSDDFTVQRLRINYSDCIRRDLFYQSKVKIFNNSQKQYLYCQFEKIHKYKNIFDLKLNTEASNFEDLRSFFTFIYSIFPDCHSWKYVIDNCRILEIHFKLDIWEYDLDFFRLHLSYSRSRDPFIQVSEYNRRTYYLNKQTYFYEKHNFVRFEYRLKSSLRIRRLLGSDKLLDLFKLNQKSFVSFFKKFRIHRLNLRKCDLSKLSYLEVEVPYVVHQELCRSRLSSYQIIKSALGVPFGSIEKHVFRSISFNWMFFVRRELHGLLKEAV
jgi:hypothetical protein